MSAKPVWPMEIRAASGTKVPIHFGAPARPLFGFFHPAVATRRQVGVVLVPPLGPDQTRSDRSYRHLAERLAAQGVACLRFDLFGTGDAGGDLSMPGLAPGWLDDVGAAAEELRRVAGVRSIALVGLRFGATVAMQCAAERGDVESLVLWSPCVSGAAFVGETTRLHKLYLRIEPHLALAPPAREGGLEALGCLLPTGLVDDLESLDLLRIARRPARRTLVIDGGNLVGRDALVDRLRALEAAPEVQSHPGHKFLVTVSHRSLVPDAVINSIVAWICAGHPEPASTSVEPAPLAAVALRGPQGERPVVFGRQRPLFGILTPADPARADRGRPTILLTNAGCVNRQGPHRMYVRMARRWADLGFDVLRIDLSGIGDSPAEPGQRENVTYPPSGLEDIDEALTSHGPGPFVVAGLCSGGDYAFQVGATDPRVVAAWLLNPRTFCVLELAAVESGAPPAAPVDEVPRTLRRMDERGVETLLVVSRHDPGVAYVDAHAPGPMKALALASHFRRVDMDCADHSFTPAALQDEVIDLLTAHLQQLAIGAAGEGL